MEKGQTRKEQIEKLEAEITSLRENLANLDAERSALSYKNAEGKMTNADYRRAAEVENLIRTFSAQKRTKEDEVRRLRHEDIVEIERLTAEAERKSAEACSKGEPEHSNDKSNGNGYKAVLITLLAVIAVAAHVPVEIVPTAVSEEFVTPVPKLELESTVVAPIL